MVIIKSFIPCIIKQFVVSHQEKSYNRFNEIWWQKHVNIALYFHYRELDYIMTERYLGPTLTLRVVKSQHLFDLVTWCTIFIHRMWVHKLRNTWYNRLELHPIQFSSSSSSLNCIVIFFSFILIEVKSRCSFEPVHSKENSGLLQVFIDFGRPLLRSVITAISPPWSPAEQQTPSVG